MHLKLTRPSPALVVAIVALFVALGGTAGAVVSQVAPLAKRALVADNAKKLGGQTSAQIIASASAKGAAAALSQSPAGARPASSIAGLVSVKSAPWSLGPAQGGSFTAACDAGKKATGGGFDNPVGDTLVFDSKPGVDGASWTVYEQNLSSSAGASGNVYVVCGT